MAISGLLLCEVVPLVIFGPMAGVLVDRWRHRTVMVGSDLIRSLLWLALALSPGLVTLYAAVFLSNMASVFFSPSRSALLPEIVGAQQLTAAVGLSRVATQATNLVGPALGGATMLLMGASWLFAVNSLSFFLSALLLWRARLPVVAQSPSADTSADPQDAQASPGFWRQFLEGFSFLRSSNILWFIVTLLGLFSLLGRLIQVAYLDYVRHVLGLSSIEIGAIVSMEGAGAVVGALLAGVLAKRIKRGILLRGTLATMMLLLALFLMEPGFAGTAALVAFAGIANMTITVPLTAIFMTRTPTHLRGRIFGTANALMTSLGLVGLPFAGLVVGGFGSARTLGWVGVVGLPLALLAFASRGGRAMLREE
jgi:MFS family permease